MKTKTKGQQRLCEDEEGFASEGIGCSSTLGRKKYVFRVG
jgi:hypothetical protein